MVRISSIVMFFLASALSVQACSYCQCKFSNGDHCCVYSDSQIGNLDCATYCARAHRADGEKSSTGPGTACAAGGKYQCTNAFSALDRISCYQQG